ncbi:peptidase domain-containing ABC transporter [Cruoricaptor ignavus]|uniref:Peptidase domain-containing ABC transporter n=1 Tax=Cruoricaptor ignavus TaxID=1118202 RepID=A0A7M1T1U6_9FLAO|nr:peptidase domain-containing ABC transporter [Cruoricaptor ignavus]QOR73741.1 peptidase domain-containing ABC transporter [Cruoricaptor ignavus]
MKIIIQHDQMDCGPACLAMIASSYGKNYSLQYLRDHSFITKEGVSMFGIVEASKKIGFETLPVKLTVEKLINFPNSLPCILHWGKNHFVVLKKVTKKFMSSEYNLQIADPAHGLISIKEQEFKKYWISSENMGIALILKPSEDFFALEVPQEKKITLSYILKYLTPYKWQLVLMFLLLLAGSAITLVFPFLTQALIDKGVSAKNLNLIALILLSQLGLFLGSITIEVFRNWLMLFIGTKLSITIISEFLKKMLQLPIRFFDTKKMGDFNQRIQDNERIEEFLTSHSLLTFFSIINFSVFFGVLLYYDYTILMVYLILTILSIGWSFYWLKKRKILDYLRFQQRAENQESVFEIIKGVTEMKLNQFEDFKRSQWEEVQQKLFKVNIKILKLNQIQLSGFEFMNQLKNILVTFLVATLVVNDKMTLGGLLSVSYIIGQMNSPVNQLISFFRSLQDAKLSLERLNEVQSYPTEESPDQIDLFPEKIENQQQTKGIRFENVSFQYGGSRSPYVLKNINLLIPEGKITAIVGTSGSGKTTLMKLLLKFYEPTVGTIFYDEIDIGAISPKNLRTGCGVVMQDGYIFSDTIERNIITGNKEGEYNRLMQAARTANIDEFVESLPLKFNTKIGASGNGISGGQKQRILIARAVYKDPHYIFFDEATSALDAENEKIIHDNLQSFFKGKTVIIVAHRLSTVKNADQIIVLKNGEIVEQGNHHELVNKKADYFNLVKNQLELGN